jgi:transcription initiation factor TFIID subunit TAF12
MGVRQQQQQQQQQQQGWAQQPLTVSAARQLPEVSCSEQLASQRCAASADVSKSACVITGAAFAADQ